MQKCRSRAGAESNFYEFLTPDDCPIITANNNPDLGEEDDPTISQIIHHPRGHIFIYEKCQTIGLPCEIKTQPLSYGAHNGNVQSFFIDLLTAP